MLHFSNFLMALIKFDLVKLKKYYYIFIFLILAKFINFYLK